MRISLICTGLGRVNRGFESATEQLFNHLKGTLDVTLYQGISPTSEARQAVLHVPRGAWSGIISDSRAYYYEQLTFSLGLAPFLIYRKPDIVHYSDGTLGNVIRRLRDKFRLDFRMILWNGAPFSARHVSKCDFIQQLTPLEYDEALKFGIPKSRMTMLPYGIDCETFSKDRDRDQARRAFGIPLGKTVVLGCAAINSSHKRIDYLINEFAQLDQSQHYLVLAGQRTEETSELEALARRLLKRNFMLLTVPNSRMPELYRAADVMILCSLREGLPMVLLESMASGTPVLAHDCELFRWVIGNPESLNDMKTQGRLSSRIEVLTSRLDVMKSIAARNQAHVSDNFDWKRLLPKYVQMYEKIARLGSLA